MTLSKKIVDLIHDEQIRQTGNFVPEGEEYLEKLAVNAELLSHDSLDQCLGFVFFYCNDPSRYSSYITLLMVAQASRKSGIGAALVRYVLTLTAQRGFKVCCLEVRKENAAAIKLYETMGFRQIEDRGDRYLMEAQAS
jgi:ribosomal protein S18 acetylase RimI-like enzyme